MVYDAYFDCRKHKRGKESTILFSIEYEKGVRQLTDDLWNRTYTIGKSIVFPITRPKHREVFAADFRDRIVHHLIMNEIGEILDRDMIADSFSCRKGKGTQYGQKRLQAQILEVSNDYTEKTYTLSADIKGFFMSIGKENCYNMLERIIRERYKGDVEFVLWLTKMVVLHRPELYCEIRGDKKILDGLPDNKTLFRSNGKGFPIGNLTSQIFGNYYLTEFDKWSIQYIGEESRYCRYVDDVRVTSRDKKMLMRYIRDARIWLMGNLGIELHWNKWSMQEVHNGIPFIGCVIKPWGIYARNRMVTNAFYAVRKVIEPSKYIMRLNSYFGFLIHNLTYGIRRRLCNEIPEELRPKIIITNYRKISIIKPKKYGKSNTTHRGLQRNREERK